MELFVANSEAWLVTVTYRAVLSNRSHTIGNNYTLQSSAIFIMVSSSFSCMLLLLPVPTSADAGSVATVRAPVVTPHLPVRPLQPNRHPRLSVAVPGTAHPGTTPQATPLRGR